VLDRARQEFARYTCLTFDYQGIKVGRKYQQVDIEITKNDVFKPRVRLPDSIARRVPREADAEARLKALQARDALLDIGWAVDPDSTVKQFGARRVIDIVRYAKTLQRKAETTGRPILNLPGFVHSLLQQGIEPPAADQDPAAEQRLTREAVRGIAASIGERFHQHRRQQAQRVWDELSASNRGSCAR
jgi:hypothetical protein